MTDKIKFDIIELILIVIELYFGDMMLLTKVLLPIAMIIIPAFLILALIKSGKNPTSADDEEQLYRQMLQNPTDAAVKRYIRALDGYCRRTERPPAGDRVRQLQGYFYICKCPSVSPSVRKKLKMCYVANGILAPSGRAFSEY